MDEKTEQLRDLFLETTEETTITDHQTDTRGSLTDSRDVDQRVAELLTEMRDRYTFQTDLSDEQLQTIVAGYYDDSSDDDLADALSISVDTVRSARHDLHLVRATDFVDAIDRTQLHELYVDNDGVETIADVFGVSVAAARQAHAAIVADDQSRRANHRYRDAFAELFADADLAGSHTDDALEDGLEDATDGLETNVSF